jgi:hypothetical protein
MVGQRPMALFDTDRWTIDEDNKLYWDGKPIVTEEKLIFQKRVNGAIYLTAGSTAFYALIEFLKFLGYGVK